VALAAVPPSELAIGAKSVGCSRMGVVGRAAGWRASVVYLVLSRAHNVISLMDIYYARELYIYTHHSNEKGQLLPRLYCAALKLSAPPSRSSWR
jgi:hypothetical protein